ncbi:glycosyltransferase family 4 protein [Alteromonas ponticola]|uniref:Glycosyltransferase family 4 protein n=1 Tax=Alteromonas ponticola TaxID=2720613 RepID=A0ABX1R0T1_9ALTE|nr:glycosyltransferase family 4 protein [Alteromonas ponticola]NMH59061.1 glycosyltransferase family 4 protein [Alteromonas ponticola]
MKIGYIYDLQIFPPKGGNHTHALEVSENLTKLGHEIFVVNDPTNPVAVKSFDPKADNWVDEFLTSIDVLMLRVDARFISKMAHFMDVYKHGLSVPLFLEINSPSYEAMAYSWLGGRNLWLGVVKENPLKKLKRWLHQKRVERDTAAEESFRKTLAESVAGAICVSSGMGGYASSLGIKNVKVIPNGGPLVTDEFISNVKSDENNEQFTLLFAGSSVYPWQGLDILADTIRLASSKKLPIHFRLIINGPLDGMPELDNVSVRQKIPREEVLTEIANADACIALIHQWHWCPDGFYLSPIKIFEYLSMGAPVITSNHSQMKELLVNEKSAFLVENDPAEILDVIMKIKDDRQLLKTVGENGQALVRTKLNWPNVAAETDQFLKQVLAQKA